VSVIFVIRADGGGVLVDVIVVTVGHGSHFDVLVVGKTCVPAR
jgi:hypothetical protein